jgi:hypothetical protein
MCRSPIIAVKDKVREEDVKARIVVKGRIVQRNFSRELTGFCRSQIASGKARDWAHFPG